MALTTSMPVIGDLTMKFSRHSIHDRFQLPARFYQYFGHSNDFSFYFQPNELFASPRVRPKTFEFQGSSGDGESRGYSGREEYGHANVQCNEENAVDLGSTPTGARTARHGVAEGTFQAVTTVCKDSSAPSGVVNPHEENEEGGSSDEEELVGYFTRRPESFSQESTAAESRSYEKAVLSRDSSRKRSMKDDDYLTTKRCRRPRLNFEKMQWKKNEESEGDGSAWESFFRPITPLQER